MRKRDKNPIYFHIIINQNYIMLIYIFLKYLFLFIYLAG